MMTRRLGTHALLASTVIGCGLLGPDEVSQGWWKGESIRLLVEEDAAFLELACAHGRTAESLDQDENGHFAARGFFVLESPVIGPSFETDTLAAVYTGRITRDEMTLHVHLTARDVVSSYRLERADEQPMVQKCV